jgi:hypothetical protein
MSLLEILVALALGAALFGALSVSVVDHRRNLNKGLDDIERAFRFAASESALRNALIRLHIKLGTEENLQQSYSLQHGPSGSFVLPKSILKEAGNESESEREDKKKKEKKMSRQFNKIEEFQESEKELEPLIRFVGIGTSLKENLITEGEASLFTYPTGEKDSAIVILASDDEVAYVEVSPFTMEFEREYKPLTLEGVGEEEILEKQRELADEIFSEWKNKK